MNVSLLRHGFILILLALAGGLFIPAMAVPRLGLSAHTIGVLGGVLLIALGAIWPQFRLSAGQARAHQWAWLYSSYVNWFACLLGGALGAGKTTPLASAGFTGTPLVDGTVTALLVSVAVASFIAVGLSLWGLRPAART
jgi:(hydroxyamino)benzene mutase